ncbi:hypothetical protein [Aureispira anguillae]|uniref:Uncharacterized protein n=1 Tax=Aureispira anguillae TaxID=2864201 RepID=A0A916DWX8_9BACT|nr:hypothetical protein [Aureispira anguillae]BDS15297.1 hypothetical protein AsAng_0060810 [Aureispira anguillae]
MKFHLLFFLLCYFVNTSNLLLAQESKTENVPAKLSKRERDYLAAKNYAATVHKVSKMTREEKNTATECPLHNRGKEMPLSDNYRANASDYTTCYEYPFAYQLNYRRYCKVCTKIMAKESGDNSPVVIQNTFERCAIHNVQLKGNPDYDKVMYERNPNSDTPHAKQYWFKNYCKTCTKIVKAKSK